MRLSKFFLKNDMFYVLKKLPKKLFFIKSTLFVSPFRTLILIYSILLITSRNVLIDNISLYKNNIILNKVFLFIMYKNLYKSIYIN